MNKLSYLLLSLGLVFGLAGVSLAQVPPSLNPKSYTTDADVRTSDPVIVLPDSKGNCPEFYKSKIIEGEGSEAICVKANVTSGPTNTGVATGVSGQATTQAVKPVNGQCPSAYTPSPDGLSCFKPWVASGELGQQVVGSGQFTVVAVDGECPEGYLADTKGEACLKPSVNVGLGEHVVIDMGPVSMSVEETTALDNKKKVTVDNAAGFSVTVTPSTASAGGGGSSGPSSVAISEGAAQVTIKVEDGKKVLTQGRTEVSTSASIVVDEGKIMIGDGKKELKVMPATASRAVEALGKTFDKVELRGSYYYFIQQVPAKLFGFIPVKLSVSTQVDVENEANVKAGKSWWAFLATEAEVAI